MRYVQKPTSISFEAKFEQVSKELCQCQSTEIQRYLSTKIFRPLHFANHSPFKSRDVVPFSRPGGRLARHIGDMLPEILQDEHLSIYEASIAIARKLHQLHTTY